MTADGRRILVRGVVQGVGFRPFVYRIAHRHGLVGSVRNLGDAGVEILITGSETAIDDFVAALTREAPPLARIDALEMEAANDVDGEAFVILQSADTGDGAGQLPPDVATCDACVAEILGESRFHGYWATSCTDCGPRFTVIESLPYDRPRTTMSAFPMCRACDAEYTSPLDRRYHAQTTACDACGPTLTFDGDAMRPIDRAADALAHGRIVAIKGIGGTHIACDATDEQAVQRLRERLGRTQQPFALMAKEETLEPYVRLSVAERDELRSSQRPIVVSCKIDPDVLPGIAPGLHTIGVMLPYSGLHHLLFDAIDGPLVMTSANAPGRPMLIENDEILEELRGVVDHALLHDRRIAARCDDSVRRAVAGRFTFLRRSRGFVPQGIERSLGDEPILALGPESDLTFALYDRGRVTPSQHIGNVDDLDTLAFLRAAIDHLMAITNARRPSMIACDAHPRFLTTSVADELADAWGARVIPVQHHAAHLVSAMVEHEVSGPIVGLIVDGYGYGIDGQAWGGEVLMAGGGVIERRGCLRPVRLPVGDLAARRPLRMAAAYLDAAGIRADELVNRLMRRGMSGGEADLLVHQVRSGMNAPWTTSAGRFLDAVSAWINVCRVRTYEGEPAMRLEASALHGTPQPLDVRISNEDGLLQLDVADLFLQLVERSGTVSADDLAATAQAALAQGTAEIARCVADACSAETIVLSGGVAYNDHIVRAVRAYCEEEGLRVLTQELVPCGDGGVALGQVGYAAMGYRWSERSDVHM